jgi:predicted O-methyltransferase YrrM
MKKGIEYVKRYIAWRLHAKQIGDIDDDFVFDLVLKLRRKKVSHHCLRYDKYVSKLKKSKRVIETVDFGAGAGNKDYKTKKIRVGKLVKQRSHKPKQLHLLYRLAEHFIPKTILELGTAVGVSTVYLKKSIPHSRMVTIEGCEALANRAKRVLKELHVYNTEVVVGTFDTVLPQVLKTFDKLDMVYFDGNHRKEPTLKYFEQCLPLAHEDSVFIFDDIHWSQGMEQAWKTIQNDERVTLTLDLFWFGLVFFKKDIEKQNLSVVV